MKKILIIGVGSINFFNISVGQELPKHNVIKSESAILRDSIPYVSKIKSSLTEEKNKPLIAATKNINFPDIEKKNCILPGRNFNDSIRFQENLELAKSKKGKEYFDDGSLKLALNINMIESYYRFCQNNDSLVCWIDLIERWDLESISDLYISYINFDVNKSSLIEVNQNLARKYKERDDTTIIRPNSNFITNVVFEDP
jgi:hypothetical protein